MTNTIFILPELFFFFGLLDLINTLAKKYSLLASALREQRKKRKLIPKKKKKKRFSCHCQLHVIIHFLQDFPRHSLTAKSKQSSVIWLLPFTVHLFITA